VNTLGLPVTREEITMWALSVGGDRHSFAGNLLYQTFHELNIDSADSTDHTDRIMKVLVEWISQVENDYPDLVKLVADGPRRMIHIGGVCIMSTHARYTHWMHP